MKKQFPNRFRPGGESLEDRRLMAVAAVGLQSNGVLVVAGTPQDDVILVREQNNQITIEGRPEAFNVDQVTAVFILAGDGNDGVFNATSRPSVVFAGEGDDFVVGGAATDFLFGQGGNDYIFGQSGSDYIEGGVGNDMVVGGDGLDFVYGGDGMDMFNDPWNEDRKDQVSGFFGEINYWTQVSLEEGLTYYQRHLASKYTPNYAALAGQQITAPLKFSAAADALFS